MLTMWLGELITQHGLGNGISLIITASILSQAPFAIRALLENGSILVMVVLALLAVAIIAAIVFVKDRKSTRLNSSHANISYAVFCLKKKINTYKMRHT